MGCGMIKMLKEVDLQAKVKDAIIEMGGFSMKMSNRFLIGVPDLLCKLPNYPTSFWEVKRVPFIREKIKADATLNQKKWLRDFERAGGFGGLICFVMQNDLTVAVRPTTSFDYEDLKAPWWFYKEDFVTLPRNCKMQPFKELLEEVHKERRSHAF